MSDDASFLSDASAAISSESSNIQGKIDQLRTAKNNIIEEQSTCMNEIDKIVDPTLIPFWDGVKGQAFDEKREEVYNMMEAIYTDEYDEKVSQIETKISWLETQLSVLSTTSSLVDTANDLYEKGEEVVQELSSTIDDIKGRLPWV